MSWERDPLWAKAKLVLQQAFQEERESPLYGLRSSFGLEILARAALASVSPTLLAASASDHKHLLHALGRGSEKSPRRSIDTNQVLTLCNILFAEFTPEDVKAATALFNRRNEELHSGTAAFNEYPTKLWLPGFYRVCQHLTAAMGESLVALFGQEEAAIAEEVLRETQQEVKKKVLDTISNHRRVVESLSEAERQQRSSSASDEVARLVHQRHHKMSCPACGADATVTGATFGQERVTHEEDGTIIVRQPVTPRAFSCSVCGLQLKGYGQLDSAGLGGQYTRTSRFTPEEYYGLIDPEGAEMAEYVEKYLTDIHEEEMYDND